MSERVLVSLILFIKNIIGSWLYLLSKLFVQREPLVLLYHSIGLNDDHYNVKPVEFRRQIAYLRKNYSIVSLDRIGDFVREGKSLPRKSAAITFDDGYYDIYLNAYPVLRKCRLPAAIFVTTGFVLERSVSGQTRSETLSWDHIKEMSANGVTIGAHTVTHLSLPDGSLERARREVLASKAEIEKNIGKPVRYFAYPHGRYSEKVVRLVESAGFDCGFGTRPWLIRKNANAFTLNRICIDSLTSFREFKVRLTKAPEWYKRVEQIVKSLVEYLPFMPLARMICRETDQRF